jgi:hypothetical protein
MMMFLAGATSMLALILLVVRWIKRREEDRAALDLLGKRFPSLK